jgi:transketolase
MTKTIREAYGEALVKYGCINDDVVVLDADVSSSTRTSLFANRCPERFFNIGIAEANMTAMAAGLASVGKIPFVNTFAVFISSLGLIAARAFASYSNLNVKMIGAYSGLSDAFDGPSHQSMEDIAIMRSLPNFKVFVASDEKQTDWLVKHAINEYGPMYIRLSRDKMADLYDDSTEFQEGKGQVVRDGRDATVIACGVMSGVAMQAAELLSQKGIEIRIVDMFTIKPIDRQTIILCALETGALVTAEEHSIIGGLGSSVAEVLVTENLFAPVEFVGINDHFAEWGKYSDLLSKYCLDAPAIAAAVERVINKKKK